MKRGKEEDKIMGPMFPRLHVNEIDKRGPRAPPRNKMALYEQLSIPSQRFTHTVPPQNSSSGTSDLMPSESQGGGSDKGMLFTRHLPPKHQFEKQYNQYSDLITPLTNVDKQKELDDEDFRVPIFIHSVKSMEHVKQTDDPSTEIYSLSKPSCFNPSSKLPNANIHREEKLKELVSDGVKAITENTEVDKEQLNVSPCHERLKTDSSVQPEPSPESQPDSGFVEKENIFTMEERGPSPTKRVLRYETKSYEDESCRSPRAVLLERGDSVSEATIAGSIARLDITPDDVVGVIGQKRFWKARRAIVNQQRVFADQIFELHRLMKVQKSISTHSEYLAEGISPMAEPIKVSVEKKLPLDSCVKPLPSISKQKGGFEKPSHKEGSADNTAEKSTLTSHQNTTLPFHHKQSSNISSPLSITSSHNARSMCTNQSQGSQWLIPVMSPSEGLVYKPYPVPGFVGTACGPWGASGPTASHHNFLTQAYGVPAPYQQYQFPSFPIAGPHPYFPAYGMPLVDTSALSGSSIEQANQPPLLSQFSFGNTPSQSNISGPASVNLYASKEQVSTTSNLNERTEHAVPGDASEERNKLQLFSKSQAEPDHPPRVIKVVPHKPGFVTESVARIFRSIQEERKQHSSA